jgi:hypothetical protein
MLNPAEAGFRAWTETRGWGAEEGSRHSPLYIIGTVRRACKAWSVVAGVVVARWLPAIALSRAPRKPRGTTAGLNRLPAFAVVTYT